MLINFKIKTRDTQRVKPKKLSLKTEIEMTMNERTGSRSRRWRSTSRKDMTVKEIIYESAIDSTAHSIPYIFKRDNYFIKIFWVISFFASTILCGWMIYKAIFCYVSYETVSKTQTVLEIPTTFPTISICNMNSYLTNYSIDFVESILTENGIYNPNSQVNIDRSIVGGKYRSFCSNSIQNLFQE
jgi:hypothetical protein